MFYGFYHGKSPFFTTIWGYLGNMLVILVQPPCLFNEIFPPTLLSVIHGSMGSTQRPTEILQRETPPVNQTGTAGVKIEDFFGNFGDFSGVPAHFFWFTWCFRQKKTNLSKSSIVWEMSHLVSSYFVIDFGMF